MHLVVEHPKYPELGQGEVVSENEGKATVEFKIRTIVFPLSDLTVVPPTRKQIFVRRGEEKILLDEVKKEQIEFVMAESQDWTTVQELVNKTTKHFSQYTMEDGSPLNQGGFDPMFCVSRQNPGILIRTGKIIFPDPVRHGIEMSADLQDLISKVRFKSFKNEFSFWIEILRQELVQQQMIPMRSEIILSSMIWTGKLLLNKE